MRRLAQVAPELVTTNFALAGKRGANGEKGARGKILQIGSRFYEYNVQEWGPYAHRGSEENYSELFAAAQLLTAAMVKADAPHNQVEQERARAAIRALCRSTAGPKLRPLLHDANLVGVFGFGAGNPQHTDPQRLRRRPLHPDRHGAADVRAARVPGLRPSHPRRRAIHRHSTRPSRRLRAPRRGDCGARRMDEADQPIHCRPERAHHLRRVLPRNSDDKVPPIVTKQRRGGSK